MLSPKVLFDSLIFVTLIIQCQSVLQKRMNSAMLLFQDWFKSKTFSFGFECGTLCGYYRQTDKPTLARFYFKKAQ